MLHVPASLRVTEGVITRERLYSYAAVFHCRTDDELVGSYLWNVAACSALFQLITAAEVTLRNSVDGALRLDLGSYWWRIQTLKYKNFVPNGPVPDVVKKLREKFSGSAKAVIKAKIERYQSPNAIPTHHETIANTDFATWEYILDEEFLGPGLPWPKHMRRVFRGTWPDPSDRTTLRFAREVVADIRAIRNRVYHNEPVWKAFGVQTEADAMQYLQSKITKIEALLSLIEPQKLEMLRQSGVLAHVYRVASLPELRRYQGKTSPVNIKPVGKVLQLFEGAHFSGETRIAVVRAGGKKYYAIQPL